MLDSLMLDEVADIKISFRTTGEVTDMPLVGTFPRSPVIMGPLPRPVVLRHLVAQQRTSEGEHFLAVWLCAHVHALLTRALCGKHLRREKTCVRQPPGGGKNKHLHGEHNPYYCISTMYNVYSTIFESSQCIAKIFIIILPTMYLLYKYGPTEPVLRIAGNLQHS